MGEENRLSFLTYSLGLQDGLLVLGDWVNLGMKEEARAGHNYFLLL